jgi:hypothetical protein
VAAGGGGDRSIAERAAVGAAEDLDEGLMWVHKGHGRFRVVSARGRGRSTGGQRPGLNGHHVLYHYLQKDLLRNDIWLFQMLTARLVTSLGVWMHPDLYRRYPLLRPFAVRDPASRGDRKRGIPDQWGSPDKRGLFRDDNSLVKAMPYALSINAPKNPQYNGRRVEKGFVASHVWREMPEHGLASRHPLTYSFVPNLVWLPAEVSKLTDREGSFAQAYLQALAIRIYRDVPVTPALAGVVEEAWGMLPDPPAIPQEGLPAPEDLAFFMPSERFYRRNLKDLHQILDAISSVQSGTHTGERVISSRYGEGLNSISVSSLRRLLSQLQAYADGVEAGLSPGPTSEG